MTSGIFIIQTAFIGDVFLMVPLLKEVRRLYPNDTITILVRQSLGDILLKLKLVDEVYEVKKNNSESYKSVLLKLKESKFKVLLCPHESLRSALFALKIKADLKIAFKKWWNGFAFDRRVDKKREDHEVMRQLQMLEPVWEKTVWEHFELEDFFKRIQFQKEYDFKALTTPIPENLLSTLSKNILDEYQLTKARLMEQASLEKDKNYVVLFPGSVWHTKRWTPEGFSKLSLLLQSKNFKVVLMGAPDEKELCQKIASAHPQILNLAGSFKLWESFLIMTGAQLVVANDSGSMHMAALFNIPTVGIFGPTAIPLGFRPWQNNSSVVENLSLSCRPCGPHGHMKCPLGHHQCMRSISAEQVFAVCQKLLSMNKKN